MTADDARASRLFAIQGCARQRTVLCTLCRAVACVQVGDRVTAGDIYGIVKENSLMDHKVRT
jgi:vacuolar-type H+-ATPase catalytic subunit A/Vma1